MSEPNEFQPLMDDIFREKVLRARKATPGQKVADIFELYQIGVSLMRDGVRGQHPQFNEEQVEAEVRRRFARVRQIQEHGIYQPLPTA